MTPLYKDPWFTFHFDEARLIPRFHLEGIPANQSVEVFSVDSRTGERLALLAVGATDADSWVDLPTPLVVRAGDTFIAVPQAVMPACAAAPPRLPESTLPPTGPG